METHLPKRPKPSYTRHSSGTLPATVLRSQYAGNNRPVVSRPTPTPDATGPRYFSSPYRAPLNSQERQESFIEHQRSISSAYSNDTVSPPQSMQHDERSSYAFFGPGPSISSRSDATTLNGTTASRATTADNSRSEGKIGVIRQASLGHKAKPALTTVKRTDSTLVRNNAVETQAPCISKTTATELRNAVASALGHSAENSIRPAMSRNTTDKSASSQNPLLGFGTEQQGRGRNIPDKLRPPRLDMEAVREVEARGSITSLPDLIRRATRLAANLDRGRTASTFSMFDMFNYGERGGYGNRASTFSDMFPNHNNGSPSRAQKATTMWPHAARDGDLTTEKETTAVRNRGRKCCGLSANKFVCFVLLVIVLVAAAVLLPIFLVVVPNQNRAKSTNLSKCSTLYPCANGGISIVDNNACSCICVDGFTGKNCSKPAGPDCVTSDIEMGSQVYTNATLGDQVGPLLADANSKFGIPLNTSILLSTFASNNLSCASENSLVLFDETMRTSQKRFFILPNLGPKSHSAPLIPILPTSTRTIADKSTPPLLVVRQTTIQTSNNIVYQPTSSLVVVETQAASVTPGNSTATTTSPMPSQTNLTPDQLEFAKVVVLYVLIHSRTPSIAVTAQQMMEQYFQAGGLSSGNATVDVVNGDQGQLIANFQQFAIVLEDGRVIGGIHS